jgi:serine phosphatase RsbU (regulator of sigma subunit)
MSGADSTDERVLILAPTGRDAALAHAVLTEAGLLPLICQDGDVLCQEIASGVGVVLVTKEALTGPTLSCLREALSAQPPWSDLPLVILTSGGRSTPEGRRRLEALASLGNATLLERPLRVATLVSTVRVALQTRRRQYELRGHLQERARLEAALQAESEKQRRIAETLQRSLLPTPDPDAFAGLKLWTEYQAAWQEADIGGDFFDVFALNGDRVALMVGDVSGKGLEAASRTAEVKYALRAFLRESPSPARALDRLNDFLLDAQTLDGQRLDSFICVSLAVLDTESGRLTASCAGAESPLVIPIQGESAPIPGHGPPLSVTAAAEYEDVSLSLSPGDAVVFVTDGITEARRGRDFFGYEGLLETVCREDPQHSLRDLGQSIIGDAAAFAGGTLHDDVCLLLVRYTGPPSQV